MIYTYATLALHEHKGGVGDGAFFEGPGRGTHAVDTSVLIWKAPRPWVGGKDFPMPAWCSPP